jgi:hypothetical protein
MKYKGKVHKAQGISHSAIYPDAYWTPVGNFIEGTYRISGDIDITENDENIRRLLVFVKLMLENAAVVSQGENETHDLPFDLPLYLTENAPFLKGYLAKSPSAPLTKEQSSELFNDLAGVWRHVDDVAFKHRVFYADYNRRMRPLQLTLMHKRCYDDLLGLVGDEYTPEALFDRAMKEVAESDSLERARSSGVPASSRELYVAIAAQAFVRPLTRFGVFDDIDYHEEDLGFGEFVLQHIEGKLSKAQLFKRTAQVSKDRLVVHLLEDYKIKFAPKCIWHEDGKNVLGRGYAEFIGRVSASVTKGRKNKRQL